MSVVQFEDVVDTCILRLMAGEGLEDILTGYPDQINELSSLLSVITDTRQLASEISVPMAAQNLSRAQFLSAAAAMQPALRKPRFTIPHFSIAHFRLATSAIIVLGILAAVLLGTGLASAAALPGDVFYPVKLLVEQTQINLVQDPADRMELQETYDSRRQQEAEQLSQLNRRQQVIFGGFLQQISADNSWQVGSVKLAFPANFSTPTDLIGTYVQVTGFSVNKTVEVQDIQALQLTWTGDLQNYNDASWTIGGIALEINEETQVSGARPQIGMSVRVTAIRQAEGGYLALRLDADNEPTLARGIEKVTPLAPTLQPLRTAAESHEGSEPAGESQPAGQPIQQVTVKASATLPKPTRVNGTPVIKTVASETGNKKDDDKSMPTPAPSATLIAQKTVEKSVTTRTPTPDD